MDRIQILKTSLACLFFLFAFNECGSKAGSTRSSSLSSSQESHAQIALSTTEDATDAINDDSASGSGLLLDLELAADRDITRTRSCSVGTDGVVTVSVTLSGTMEKVLDHRNGSVTINLSASGTESRKWTPPSGQSLSCSSATGTVLIDWKKAALVNGLELDVSLNKSVTRTQTVVNSGSASDGKTKTNDYTVVGTRNVVFNSTNTTESGIEIEKTITSSVTRTLSFTNYKGKLTSTSVGISSKDGAPLVVKVARDSDGKILSKTIVSGTIVAKLKDGSTVETTFSNLVFDYSSSDRCSAKSGSASIVAYKTDGSENSKFGITFETGSVSGVSLGLAEDGNERIDFPDFSLTACELEREK